MYYKTLFTHRKFNTDNSSQKMLVSKKYEIKKKIAQKLKPTKTTYAQQKSDLCAKVRKSPN